MDFAHPQSVLPPKKEGFTHHLWLPILESAGLVLGLGLGDVQEGKRREILRTDLLGRVPFLWKRAFVRWCEGQEETPGPQDSLPLSEFLFMWGVTFRDH